MAGRGGWLVVRLVTTGEELQLPCALHTPLAILKSQLAKQTGIKVRVPAWCLGAWAARPMGVLTYLWLR